jgi:hypothetical protein
MDLVLVLTQDGEATWWWGNKMMDGGVWELVGGARWPLRRGECHTPVLGNRTEASIRVPRMFKSHVRPTIW